MRKESIYDLKPGMVLGQSVLNTNSGVELLAEGSVLTKRHISMLEYLNIDEVKILDEEDLIKEDEEAVDHVDLAHKIATEEGHDFDKEAFSKDIHSIEQEDYEKVVTSVVNQNMEIHVLTGEGNIPIDKKHEEMINETKSIFEDLKTSDNLDYQHVKETIGKAIPDMIRNNDVLMRLKQLELGDDYTYRHSLRVSILSSMIGKWLGYTKSNIEDLATTGMLFDIGKLKVPDFILDKPGKITNDEFEIVKKHPQFGYSVLLRTKGVSQDAKFGALQHHERMDGSGYPLRIRSGQIHEFAKIIMVCDIFDAMTNDRVYAKKVSPFEAAEYISWNSGHTLDSRICYIFLSNLAEFYTGKEVLLNTGDRGRIIYVDVNYPTKPIVQFNNKFVDLSKVDGIKIVELL